jgi:ABC-type amino acid transport substrate-binding protein
LEDNLISLIDAPKLFGVDSIEIGFRALLNQRLDVYISASQFDAWNALQEKEFQGQPLVEAGTVTEFQLYPYLHKKHADLAPQLAKTINQMRAEGVLDSYFSQLEAKHFKKK